MRGCIVQPPVVKARPGPLGRERLGGKTVVIIGFIWPLFPSRRDFELQRRDMSQWRNCRISAWSQSMPTTASGGRRWPILQTAPNHAHK
jgi:hypothetical protein